MYEYKVLSLGNPYLEDELNKLAAQGWRVITSFQQNNKMQPSIILERNTHTHA